MAVPLQPFPSEYPDEQIHASAVRFLIDGNEEDAANILLSCSLSIWDSGDTWYVGDEIHEAVHVHLTGPRQAYDILENKKHPITLGIKRAIQAVLPSLSYIKHLTVGSDLIEIDSEWRSELLEIARGKGISNQAANEKNLRNWKNFNFRSQSEIKIAEALEKLNVLFLPNCKARLGTKDIRQNKEADFLICYEGKWGILEVDGEPFHPPSRAAQDHERDRLFKNHGIQIVEHFDATRCYQNPDEVVKVFLNILKGK